ncbi:MAG TPA: hypothetical protein VME44_01485 [Streptosporangiaceae bacterium]|nr:hypothetical protein [Streptosporangiaceae bacterium]
MTSRNRLAIIMLAGTAVLLTLVTACSIPSRPLWWPGAKQAGSDGGDAAGSVLAVRDPWHAGMRQLGIQVYWTANRTDTSDALIRAKAERIIDYAIRLNANSIAVTFPFFTYGLDANTVYANPEVTPTAGHIAVFLAVARQAHIRVTLRPVLNENALIAQNPFAWRGSITPQNRAAWFHSYRKLLLPYAAAAQAGHAATFVLGTELDSLEGSPQWGDLVRSIRSVYSGQLTYDENYDEFSAGTAKLPVQSHDVDAYPSLGVPPSASVAQLTSSWDAWLGAHPLAVRRELTISETGIDAVAGSYVNPWDWAGRANLPIDTHVQAVWYQAACNALSAEQIGGGIYYWEVNFDANPSAPRAFESDRLTFLDRPGQRVIRNCFARLSSQGQEMSPAGLRARSTDSRRLVDLETPAPLGSLDVLR